MGASANPTRFPAAIRLSLSDPSVARHFYMLPQKQLAWKESDAYTMDPAAVDAMSTVDKPAMHPASAQPVGIEAARLLLGRFCRSTTLSTVEELGVNPAEFG